MRYFICAVAALALLGSRPAFATDVTVTLKDHQFTPQTIDVTVFDPVTVIVKNLDITAAEIGSNELKIDPILLNAGGGDHAEAGAAECGLLRPVRRLPQRYRMPPAGALILRGDKPFKTCRKSSLCGTLFRLPPLLNYVKL